MGAYRTDPADIFHQIDGLRKRVGRRETFESQDPEYRPGAPTNVTLEFRVKEKKTRLEYRALVTWDPLAPGLCLADIDEWVVQMRATNAAGTPIEADVGDPDEIHRSKIVEAREFDDTGTDFPHALIPNIDRPKKWYWQARVRIIDKERRKGEWSAWTAPLLPVQEALPKPPTPAGVALSFDRKEKNRHNPLRAVVVWDEVPEWDVPGFDEEDDVSAYMVQLRTCASDGSTTSADKSRRKRIGSEKHEEDANDTVRAIFPNPRKRQWYKARVKSVDRWNRPGDWSAWTAPGRAIDSEAPAAPTAVTVYVKQHRVQVEWDQPLDADDPDGQEIDPDIAYSIIELATDAGFTGFEGGAVKRDRYHHGQKKSFKVQHPRQYTYYSRVRNVDGAGNKSAWVSASDTLSNPSSPSVTGIAFDSNERVKGARLQATVNFSQITGHEEDIDHYVVQFQTSSTSSFSSDAVRRRAVVDEFEPADTDDQLSASFRHVKRHRYCRARVRAVDKDRRKSSWSSWSTPVQATDTNAPPNPTNVAIESDIKGVQVSWDDPTDADEADTTDRDVAYYEVEVHTNSSFTNRVRRDRHHVGTRKRFKGLSESGTYYARVRSVAAEGTKSGWATSTGVVTAPVVDTAAIVPGAVTPTETDIPVISDISTDLGTITAGTFKTGTGFPRVEITSSDGSKVKFYDSSGNLITISAVGNLLAISQSINVTGSGLFSNDVTMSDTLLVGGTLDHNGANIGFRGSTPIAKPTVSGSRDGNNALNSLLQALDDQGLINDTTTV